MYGKRFIIGDVLGFGWRVMKANLWFFVGLALVAGRLSVTFPIIDFIIDPPNPTGDEPPNYSLVIPIKIIGMLISLVIGIGCAKIALSFCDGQRPSFGTLFNVGDCFWR